MERKKNVSEKRIAEMRPRTSEGREVVVYVDKTRIKPEEIAQKIGSVVEEHLNELIGPPKRPQTRKNRAWASKRGKKGKEAQEPTRRKALQAGS